MKKHFWPFVWFWILNSILLYFAWLALPYYFVLGNKNLTGILAAFASGFAWTFITWVADPILSLIFKLEGRALMFGFYFVVNFVALWLTARMAPVFGFGTTRFVWLVYLSIIADVMQYGLWKLGKFKGMLK